MAAWSCHVNTARPSLSRNPVSTPSLAPSPQSCGCAGLSGQRMLRCVHSTRTCACVRMPVRVHMCADKHRCALSTPPAAVGVCKAAFAGSPERRVGTAPVGHSVPPGVSGTRHGALICFQQLLGVKTSVEVTELNHVLTTWELRRL